MTRHPIAIINAVIRVTELAIVMFVAFGLSWTGEQVSAVVAFVTSLGYAVQTLFGQATVTPVADPRDNDGAMLVPVFVPDGVGELG